jgi:outer membrane biosynthesis protein TonB
MRRNAPWSSPVGPGHPSWPWILSLSLMLHVLAAAGIWGVNSITQRVRKPTRVVMVRLVAPPAVSTVKAAPRKGPAEPPPKTSRRILRPVPRTERKLVTIRPSRLKVPRPKPERKRIVPSPPAPSVPAVRPQPSTTPAREAPGILAAGHPRGRPLSKQEEAYLRILTERITENWRAYLPPEEGVLGEVQILIAPNGKVRQFRFVKGSGRPHVDASIERAIRKLVLPPPPPSFADRPLLIRFWPSGP